MSHAAKITLDPEDIVLPDKSLWRKLPLIGAVLAIAGIGASAGLGWGTKQFFYSYLVAYCYFVSIAVGGLFFVIVQFAARAGWSVAVRRIAENVMITLPVFALLFIPIALGTHELYHWTHADAVAADPILRGKQAFLKLGGIFGFYGRAAIYFLVWTALSVFFYKRSTAQDKSGDEAQTRTMQAWSGPAIILFAFSVTFAAFDWLMSLDPHWYSTIFGPYFFAGSVVANFAFIALCSVLLQRSGVLKKVLTPEHYHDLGKLVFAFTVFWAYIAFSQFLLIWYGNIPEETLWYQHRAGGWLNITIILGLGHFVGPFFFMLPKGIKRSPGTLMLAATWILAIHYLDIYWLVMPVLHHHAPHFSLLDLTTLVGVGGAFLAVFGWALGRHALVPKRDPRLRESLSYENAV